MLQKLLPLMLLFVTPVQAADRLAILFIADSHGVGTFGRVLDDHLRAMPGSIVRTYASCGSSPIHWFKGLATRCGYFEKVSDGTHTTTDKALRAPTPLLSRLLGVRLPGVDARLTVVELGSNSIFSADARESHRRMASEIRKSGSRCIWIGPPRMRRFGDKKIDAFYLLLAEALHSPEGELCELIDSRKYTNYPASGGDGIHYGFPGGIAAATKWAEGVFEEIQKPL